MRDRLKYVTVGCWTVVVAHAADYGVDRFGIKKIYPDAPAPVNNWVFAGDPTDARFFEQPIVPASGGWFHPQDAVEMRVEVLSDPSANERTIETFDINKVLAKGYLYKPVSNPDGKGDFLNIEQTWRFRVKQAGAEWTRAYRTGTRRIPADLEPVTRRRGWRRPGKLRGDELPLQSLLLDR